MSAIRRLPDPDGYDSRAVLRAFEHRAANPSRIRPDGSMEGDGDLANLIRAQKARHDEQRFQWDVEDRARENRARPWRLAWRVASSMPPIAWVALIVAFLVGCVWLKAAWDASPFAQLPSGVWWVLFVAAVVAGLVWDSKRRTVVPAEVVQPAPVAPPDMYRAQKMTTWQEMGSDLPSVESRAIFNALPAAKGKRYREVIIAGLLPVPAVTREQGKRVISAMMPSGLATPDDCDVRRLAAGLGVDDWEMVRLGACTPTRLVVEVLDEAPSKLVAGAWPALGRQADWTKRMPLGVSDTGEPVSVPLFKSRFLVVGKTGSGKSYTLRLAGLFAAADPDVDLYVFDLKGAIDEDGFEPLRSRAAYFHSGRYTPAVLAKLTEILEDMKRRYDAKTAGRSVFLLIDEAQELPDDACAVLEQITRLGRVARIGWGLGCQDSRGKTIADEITENADVRIAMRLESLQVTAKVIGSYDFNATRLGDGHAFVKVDKDGNGPIRVKIHEVDDEAAWEHMTSAPVAALPPGLAVLQEPAAGHENAQDDEHVCGHTSCGRPIPTGKKYCSNACKTAAYRARQAASGT